MSAWDSHFAAAVLPAPVVVELAVAVDRWNPNGRIACRNMMHLAGRCFELAGWMARAQAYRANSHVALDARMCRRPTNFPWIAISHRLARLEDVVRANSAAVAASPAAIAGRNLHRLTAVAAARLHFAEVCAIRDISGRPVDCDGVFCDAPSVSFCKRCSKCAKALRKWLI